MRDAEHMQVTLSTWYFIGGGFACPRGKMRVHVDYVRCGYHMHVGRDNSDPVKTSERPPPFHPSGEGSRYAYSGCVPYPVRHAKGPNGLSLAVEVEGGG
jgi:hypothetical protein